MQVLRMQAGSVSLVARQSAMRRTKCTMEQVEYTSSITPNAEKMVRQAGVRVARLGARTCAFRAIFAKCTAEQRADEVENTQTLESNLQTYKRE